MAKNIDDWFIWVEANRDTPTRQWTEEVLPPAKQALYKDLLELIGEDFRHSNGKYMKNPSYECEECGEPDPEYTINVVQREIRTRLATYFGVEE